MLLAQSPTSTLTFPDYAIILLYLVGTIALGILIGRKVKTGSDFFLAGRQLPWWAIGMSLVATDIGGTDIIGVGGTAYRHGLAVANFEWIGCVPAMIVGAFLFIPFLYRTGVYTVPEYLERRYNAGVRSIMAICWVIFMACNLGVMLLASATMMSEVFGWTPSICILVTAGLVGLYTVVGGLAAVVYTDAIQCAVMILGCLLVLVLGVIEVGGVREFQSRLAAIDSAQATSEQSTSVATDEESRAFNHHTALILPADTETPFPWTGIYFGLALILSPAYWIGNQAIVQRSLGARSEFEAKASYIWGALLKNVIPIIVALPGLVAVILIPDLSNQDAAIPTLVGTLLPVGARGLFVAAFLAALMSSIDSYLNSAATIVSNDFYKRFFDPQVNDKRLLSIGRITTGVLVAWAVLFAFVLSNFEAGIYTIFQTLMAFFQGPALAVLLLGMLWKRATGLAAVIALLSGIGTSVSLHMLNQPIIYSKLGWEPLFKIQDPFLYLSIWAFLVSACLLVVLSLVMKPEPDEKLQYVLRASSKKGETIPSGAVA